MAADTTVTVTVTLFPAASEPEAGENDKSPAGDGLVGLSETVNFTGPPSAVSVNDPAYAPPAGGWLSTTCVGKTLSVPGVGGGVGDADGEDDRLRDADGVGVALRPAAGVVAAG